MQRSNCSGMPCQSWGGFLAHLDFVTNVIMAFGRTQVFKMMKPRVSCPFSHWIMSSVIIHCSPL